MNVSAGEVPDTDIVICCASVLSRDLHSAVASSRDAALSAPRSGRINCYLTQNVDKTVLNTISVDKHGLDCSRIEHLPITGGGDKPAGENLHPPERRLHRPHRLHRTEGIMLTTQGRTVIGDERR
jgi:hypothetical protein